MGKPDPAKVARMKPKGKCCRSSRRCVRCPVVIHKMQKAVDADLSPKELRKALKKARAA